MERRGEGREERTAGNKRQPDRMTGMPLGDRKRSMYAPRVMRKLCDHRNTAAMLEHVVRKPVGLRCVIHACIYLPF